MVALARLAILRGGGTSAEKLPPRYPEQPKGQLTLSWANISHMRLTLAVGKNPREILAHETEIRGQLPIRLDLVLGNAARSAGLTLIECRSHRSRARALVSRRLSGDDLLLIAKYFRDRNVATYVSSTEQH